MHYIVFATSKVIDCIVRCTLNVYVIIIVKPLVLQLIVLCVCSVRIFFGGGEEVAVSSSLKLKLKTNLYTANKSEDSRGA